MMAAKPADPSTWVLTFPSPLDPGVQIRLEMEDNSSSVGSIKEMLKRSRIQKDRQDQNETGVKPQCWEVRQQLLLPTPEMEKISAETLEETLEDDIETCVVNFENMSDTKEERGTKTEVMVRPDCVITIEEEEVDLEGPEMATSGAVLDDDFKTCVVSSEEESGLRKEKVTQSEVTDGGSVDIEDLVVESKEKTDFPKVEKAIQTDEILNKGSEFCRTCNEKAADSEEGLMETQEILEENNQDRGASSEKVEGSKEEVTQVDEDMQKVSPKKVSDPKGEGVIQVHTKKQKACNSPEAEGKEEEEKSQTAILEEGGVVMETARQGFRWFRYQEAEGPRHAYEQLQGLCRLWLKPERRSKEQILELLVLEQFLAILPQGIQRWLWQQHPETCTQAVDLVENFLTGLSLLQRHGKKALVTFEEVAVYFSEEEQRLLDETQKKVYREIMLENYENVQSLGFPVSKPDLISKMESNKEQELCFTDPQNSGEKKTPRAMEDAPISNESDCEVLSTPKDAVAVLPPTPQSSNTLEVGDASVKSTLPKKDNNRLHRRRNVLRYACSECGKTFPWESALARHQLSHSDKPFQCSDCPKSFDLQSKLIRHKRIHTGELTCKCTECGKVVSDRYKLAQHLKLHSGEQPYRCDVCGVGFCLSSHLHQHRRIHMGDRPHACPECGRGFTRRSNLNQHLRLHKLKWQKQGGQSAGLPPGDSELREDFGQCEEEWEYELIADTLVGEPTSENPSGNPEGEPRSELLAGTHESEEIMELSVGDYECGWNSETSGKNHDGSEVVELHTGNQEPEQSLESHNRVPESEEIVELCVGNADEHGWNEDPDGDDDDCLLITDGRSLRSDSCPDFQVTNNACLAGNELPGGSGCGRTFTQNLSLTQHQLIYATEHPHSCQECCLSFSLPSLLTQHQLTHATGQSRMYPNNPKTSSHSSKLKWHQSIHQSEHPFQCEECGKCYRDSSALLQHQHVHGQSYDFGLVPSKHHIPSNSDSVVVIL